MSKLSIIIPVYNESTYISRCLENVLEEKLPNFEKEIIIVDDGSTDNTLETLSKFQNDKSIKIIPSPVNKGKGNALKQGIQNATGDFVIIQDADLEYDPNDYLKILEEFKKEQTSVVYGSRILGAKIYHNYSANVFFLMGGILLTKIVNLLFKTQLTDQPTCYKSWKNNLSRGLLEYCKSDGFEFEVEMTAFFSSAATIKEVPIHYYPRTISHGKKIRLKDFFKSLFVAFHCRFFRKTKSIS
jgi:glycosyltransferase involved in cell wall biosynthesis